MKKLLFGLIVLFGLYSCEDEESQYEIDDRLIQEYLAENDDINAVSHSAGFYYEITNEGDINKKPTAYSLISIRYKGYLLDGTVFDDTEGEISSMYLENLISGWQYGIPLIGKGGEIKLILPSNLGYGEYSPSSSIPANSILIFDIELVGFRN